ncbi:MAG TPA: sigma-54-dependent Fis family transcriptional regulator, partial [Thermoanaerobaculia bacterium]|nr:sigma-54-dependent Fis family transcriptional regulator [Thermoanaerobaculia bacterium]
PPLMDRRDDIPLLAEHFRKMIEDQERAGVTGWEPAALELLNSFDWPGNVRELRNIVHRAYVMTEGKTIRAEVVAALLPPARAAAAKRPTRGTRPAAPKSSAARATAPKGAAHKK